MRARSRLRCRACDRENRTSRLGHRIETRIDGYIAARGDRIPVAVAKMIARATWQPGHGAVAASGIRFPQRVAGLKPDDQDAARHTATINVVRIVPTAREIAQAGTVADWPALFGHQQRDGATKRVEERR